jgi:hypothetical protein
MMGQSWTTKDGEYFYSSQCDVHDWRVEKSFGDSHVGGIPWSFDQERRHRAVFDRIQKHRRGAQDALDVELQHRLDQAVLWDFPLDGDFLSGVWSLEIDLPEED